MTASPVVVLKVPAENMVVHLRTEYFTSLKIELIVFVKKKVRIGMTSRLKKVENDGGVALYFGTRTKI